jgi:hypothetical protein
MRSAESVDRRFSCADRGELGAFSQVVEMTLPEKLLLPRRFILTGACFATDFCVVRL